MRTTPLDLAIIFFTTTKLNRNIPGLLVASLLTAHDFIATIPSQAADEISIQAVLANPMVYQLHVVLLEGTAMVVQPMAPTIGNVESPCLIVGSGTFILDDGTASLQVGIPGACSPGGRCIAKRGRSSNRTSSNTRTRDSIVDSGRRTSSRNILCG